MTQGPPVFLRASVASEVAQALVAAAVAHARAEGWVVAAAVTDAGGALLALLRMDEATPPIADFARDKAYTAAVMKRSTEAFGKRMDEASTFRMGLANRERLLVWGGGLPIVHEGRVIGGIGVSGAKDFQDIACGEAALRAAGLGWQVG